MTQLGCGTLKYVVPSSAVAPGADAKVIADVHEKQNQTLLEVQVKNLVPPARVSADAAAYVAWYRRDQNAAWSRIGALAYDDRSREGSLTGSVPELAFYFQISAEPAGSPVAPSSIVMFSQHIHD
jgi:hypothetical protein